MQGGPDVHLRAGVPASSCDLGATRCLRRGPRLVGSGHLANLTAAVDIVLGQDQIDQPEEEIDKEFTCREVVSLLQFNAVSTCINVLQVGHLSPLTRRQGDSPGAGSFGAYLTRLARAWGEGATRDAASALARPAVA